MATSKDNWESDAIALLPASGETTFDAYKASLYDAYPDNGKELLSKLLASQAFSKRIEIKEGHATLYVSRKVK